MNIVRIFGKRRGIEQLPFPVIQNLYCSALIFFAKYVNPNDFSIHHHLRKAGGEA
jgi:hypothetical protein